MKNILIIFSMFLFLTSSNCCLAQAQPQTQAQGQTNNINMQEVKNYYDQGVVAYNNKNYYVSEAIFDELYKVIPNKSFLLYVGESKYNLNKYDESLPYYLKYIQEDSSNFLPYYKVGKIYLLQEKYQQCLSYLLYAQKINPNIHEMDFLLSQAFYQLTNYNQTITYSTNSLNKNFIKEEIFIILGDSYAKLNQVDMAIKCFQQGIKYYPNNCFNYYGIANIYLNMERYQESIPYLNKVIEINPNFADAHFFRGIALASLEDIDGANKEYNLLKKINYPNLKILENAIKKALDKIMLRQMQQMMQQQMEQQQTDQINQEMQENQRQIDQTIII